MKWAVSMAVAAIASLGLAGCASEQSASAGGAAGPGAEGRRSTGTGELRVFSATEEHDTGGETFYYPHTPYVVLDRGGKVVIRVPNHIGNMDEAPTIVRLPAGSYVVWAEDVRNGRVKIPVIIEAGHMTTLHLDGRWTPPTSAAKRDLLELPDGEYIGWRARTNQGGSMAVRN